MAFVIFLPCKKTIWELRWQLILKACIIGLVDLVGQSLAKNALALTTPALYTVLNSGGSVITTALCARFIVRKKFNVGMWLGMVVILGGVVWYSFAKTAGAGGGILFACGMLYASAGLYNINLIDGSCVFVRHPSGSWFS